MLVKLWWIRTKVFDPGLSPIVTSLKPLQPDYLWVAEAILHAKGAAVVGEDQLEEHGHP